MNGPLGHYLACWAKFNDFGGRSRRSEYWWFFLLNQAVGTLVAIVFGSFETLSLFYTIAVTPAAVAALVRRLHDTGRSAWNLLWLLVPFIGIAIVIFYLCQDGTPGENCYGPDPKESDAQ